MKAEAKTARSQVSYETKPNRMHTYLKGGFTILNEVIAQKPPDRKASMEAMPW